MSSAFLIQIGLFLLILSYSVVTVLMVFFSDPSALEVLGNRCSSLVVAVSSWYSLLVAGGTRWLVGSLETAFYQLLLGGFVFVCPRRASCCDQ